MKNYPRDISKRYPKKGVSVENPKTISEWPLESELGALVAHLSAQKKPKERLVSLAVTDLYLLLIQKMAYRPAAETVTRVLHLTREQTIKTMTLKDRIENIGLQLSKCVQDKADCILKHYKIDPSVSSITEEAQLPASVTDPNLPKSLTEDDLRKESAAFNAKREEPCQMKDTEKMRQVEASPQGCVYVSIDDIGVKHQKESRANGYKRKQVYVENTVIHIQEGDRIHTLTAIGMKNAMHQLLAFLLHNHLLENHRLIFFTDGATCIKENIEKYFSFREYTLILDWLHLRKKCNELLSMGIKGSKAEKSEIKRTLMKILWSGNVSDAKSYIGDLKKKNVKNPEILEDMREYLDRKCPYIACYALRCRLRLRNSSNRVEKENQLIVAKRQKHQGMSWSYEGSCALTAIAAAQRNGELTDWVHKEIIPFAMSA